MSVSSNDQTPEKPVQTVKSLSLDRGLNAVELEKEGRENGFVVTISGVDMINVEKYDEFVFAKIAKARPRKKPKSRQNLANTDGKGVLKIHLNRFPDRIAKKEKEIKKLIQKMQETLDGIEQKQHKVDFNKEESELAQLKRDQMDAVKQINFLLDLEIAETTPPEPDDDDKQEEK